MGDSATVATSIARAEDKLLVFVTPSASIDVLWMADAKGIFKAAGLDVQVRAFPSGTTAIQTFQTGVGDIIFTGDLPALQFWQNGGGDRVISPIERDAKGYIGVARTDIKTAADLKGKSIATRVGSTGVRFLSVPIRFSPLVEPSTPRSIGALQVTSDDR